MSQRVANTKGRRPLPNGPTPLSPRSEKLYQSSKAERARAMPTKTNTEPESNITVAVPHNTEKLANCLNSKASKKSLKRALSENSEEDDMPKAKKAKLDNPNHLKNHKEQDEKLCAASHVGKYPKYRNGYLVEFRWAQNGHITRDAAIINQPDVSRLSFTLIDTTGHTWPVVTYVHAPYFDWSCKTCIRELNKWHKQFIYRRLDLNDPTIVLVPRPTWTWLEELYIGTFAVKFIEKNKRKPKATADWKKITDEYNKLFEGKIARAGDLLAEHVPERSLRKDHVIMTRTVGAVRGYANKWPTVKKMMSDAMEEVDEESSDEDGEIEAEEDEADIN